MKDGRETRRRTEAGEVAIVAPTREVARAAAAWLKADLPEARLLPLTVAGYCGRRGAPLPLLLAAPGLDPEADRAFLIAARGRLLWPPAAGDLYDAIAGVLTHLPVQRVAPEHGRGPATALLLEGELTPERARSALRSSARHWIVEHVGRVRLGPAEIDALSNEGVRWSALQAARLVGIAIAGPSSAPRGIFPAGTRVFRAPPAVNRARAPGARTRRPSSR
ncbi:MAG: hypothetical protein ABI682_09765 [Acidobacteriota bacterium]